MTKGGNAGANEPEQIRKQTAWPEFQRHPARQDRGRHRRSAWHRPLHRRRLRRQRCRHHRHRYLPRGLADPRIPAGHEGTARSDRRHRQIHGRRWLAITADIRNIAELRAAAERTAVEFGGMDIVVANAGIQNFKPLLDMDDAHWHDVIDTNLNGTANTVRAFAPHLVKRGAGRLILLSSMQGRFGNKERRVLLRVEVGHRPDEVRRARTWQIQDHRQHD